MRSGVWQGISWAESEMRFAQADAHKPEKERFTKWKPTQTEAHLRFQMLPRGRQFLFFPTGEGKSKTSLGILADAGYDQVIILAPLKTHEAWKRDAAVLGLRARVETHQLFQGGKTKYPPGVPWIIDEFHKLGGRGGKGFKRLLGMQKKIDVPIIGMSATPNYNDPERCYCVEAIFDDDPTYNYEAWLRTNCVCVPSRYHYYPDVEGFLNFDSPIDYLRAKPWVSFVEDTATWRSETLLLPRADTEIFEKFGLSIRHHRIMASDMEKRHKRVEELLIDDLGLIREEVYEAVSRRMDDGVNKKWLVFCNHKTVAEAVLETFQAWDLYHITGATKSEDVPAIIQGFLESDTEALLVGTTALAEGVDGIDKACQALLILDDLDGDDAKRRQIIGRILPRGNDDDRERVVVTAVFE